LRKLIIPARGCFNKREEKMATTEDWILETLSEVRHALNAVLATAENLYKRFVPKEQRSRAEQLYKTYVPELPKRWGTTRRPDIDIIDLGTEIHLVADLPGVKKADIDIDLTSSTVDVTAEPKTEVEREQQPYAHRERGYVSYKRRIYLPASVIPEKAKARFNNGVLEITMPRKEPVEKEKPVKINIKDIGEKT
jgi:HSP20 family molecular chaperone IbpA